VRLALPGPCVYQLGALVGRFPSPALEALDEPVAGAPVGNASDIDCKVVEPFSLTMSVSALDGGQAFREAQLRG
jgi:hypothetical protein